MKRAARHHKYIRVSGDGVITHEKLSRTPPGPGWRRLSRAEINRLAGGSHRAYVDGDWRTGPIVPRRLVRLELASARFPADGETVMSVSVRGPELTADDTVAVIINGDRHELTRRQHVEFVAEQPGSYEVRLADIRFRAHRPRRTIIAYDPDEEAEEA